MTASRDQEIRETMFGLREKASKINSKRRRVKSVNIKKGFGRTCILYTEDMEYIGIFECEDTGGSRVRTGQVLDVYTGTTLESCYDWVEEYGTYCYMQWVESEG